MTGQDFYDFLYNYYYVWKYTAKNRLTTTRNHLSKHKDNIADLEIVKDLLFYCYDRQYYDWCLKILCEGINGLGTAGASGLLSLLFPVQFGTVDQFVVKSLTKTKEKNKVKVMNPENLKLSDAYELETIMRNKAKQLNEIFNTEGLVWKEKEIPVVVQAEPSISEYRSINNSSSDNSGLLIDSTQSKFLYEYYFGIIKLMSTEKY